jgi:hypothetical protein
MTDKFPGFPKQPVTIVNGIEYKGFPEDIIRKLIKEIEELRNKGQSYYCVIPWKLLTDKSICSSAKLLYGEISALANKEGYCWASNEHFGKTFGIKSNTRVSALVRELKEANYIYVVIDKEEGNKRRIYIQPPRNSDPILKNSNRYSQKEEEAILKNEKKDNINIDNNKENNNINDKQVVVVSEKNATITGKEFNELISLFEPVNPSFERLFPNKGQRSALERMIKKHGYEKIKWILDQLPQLAKTPYAPVVTTPYQLEQKLGQIIIFLGRENNKGGGIVDARHIK